LMQVMLRNPLADPYVLGVSGGASVAALLGLMAGMGTAQIALPAFLGALGSIALVFGLARQGSGWNPARLLLSGVGLAAGWGGLT
ncbi:MAG TPA: ABC transporter permease, partial [Gammaproteobacteria bacterium]|nr:ABC transporter permease [Gammaproteobacteria bacterium]